MIDVAEPLKPVIRSVIDLPGAAPGRPFLAAGKVLVPAGDQLHQVDVTNPRRPHLDWTAEAPVRAAASAGDAVVAALGDLGVGVVAGR
jgi:hypothetical protein